MQRTGGFLERRFPPVSGEVGEPPYALISSGASLSAEQILFSLPRGFDAAPSRHPVRASLNAVGFKRSGSSQRQPGPHSLALRATVDLGGNRHVVDCQAKVHCHGALVVTLATKLRPCREFT